MFMGFRRNVLYISERNINRLRMQQSWFSIFVKARTKLYAMRAKNHRYSTNIMKIVLCNIVCLPNMT